jgi:hypothetical protein
VTGPFPRRSIRGSTPLFPVPWAAALVGDGKDPQLILSLAVDNREGEPLAEQPAKGPFLWCARFRVLHRSPDDAHNLLEELTPEPWRMALVEPGGLSHLRQCFGMDASYHPSSILRSLRESASGRA